MANIVFVGTSLDGYIADRNGALDFLETVPNPDGIDLGFVQLMDRIAGILMGRKTLEVVLGFDDGSWPYSKPVFALSSTMERVPDRLIGKVEIVSGSLRVVVKELNSRGFHDLYIDGGQLIQGFLAEDMIDELIVAQVPVLIGGGTSLYGSLSEHLQFKLVKSKVLLTSIVQSHYERMR